MRNAIFAALAFLDFPAEVMSEKLVAVADAEHGWAGAEQVRINIRTAGFVNAGRPAGDDNAFARPQHGSGCIAWLDVRIDAQLANAPGDQVRILTACIQDGDLRFYSVIQRLRAASAYLSRAYDCCANGSNSLAVFRSDSSIRQEAWQLAE